MSCAHPASATSPHTFVQHPEEVERYIGLVRVVDVNETTLRMFGAIDKRALLSSLNTFSRLRRATSSCRSWSRSLKDTPRLRPNRSCGTLHGDRVDVLVSITFPVAGEPADSVLVTLTDITLQKLAEQARRDSEALFHEMADTAPAMLWVSDLTGAWTFLSRQWYELTGRNPEERPRSRLVEVLHPDDRDSAADAVFEATISGVRFTSSAGCRSRRRFHRWTIIAGQPRLGTGRRVPWASSAARSTSPNAAKPKRR
jgi:PAS domain S-box-containing protein